jgi:hypothetical protein
MNGPKVKGNAGLSKIRLFAGISEYLQVLVQVILGSNNPRSADNQQERPTRTPSRVGILRDHTPNS